MGYCDALEINAAIVKDVTRHFAKHCPKVGARKFGLCSFKGAFSGAVRDSHAALQLPDPDGERGAEEVRPVPAGLRPRRGHDARGPHEHLRRGHPRDSARVRGRAHRRRKLREYRRPGPFQGEALRGIHKGNT